jgi:hypothetical protein
VLIVGLCADSTATRKGSKREWQSEGYLLSGLSDEGLSLQRPHVERQKQSVQAGKP